MRIFFKPYFQVSGNCQHIYLKINNVVICCNRKIHKPHCDFFNVQEWLWYWWILHKVRKVWLKEHVTVWQKPSISQPSYSILENSKRSFDLFITTGNHSALFIRYRYCYFRKLENRVVKILWSYKNYTVFLICTEGAYFQVKNFQ